MPDKQIKKLVDNSKANFVKRLKQTNRDTILDWSLKRHSILSPYTIATHKLSVGTDEKGNHFIYPNVQEVNGKLVDYTRPPYHSFAGQDYAIERGDTVKVGNTNKYLENAIKFTEEYKKYYPKFKAGGKTKHKIEAEGGEVIQSDKPINIKRGGVAISLGNGFSLLQGKTHNEGGIDIDMKGAGRIWSNVPILNGKSPAKRLMEGENPNKLFEEQELFKKVNKIEDDGSKAKFGKDKKETFLNKVDKFAEKVEPKLATVSGLSALGSFAIPNPLTPVISIGSNILNAGVDGYQLIRSINKKDKSGIKENLIDLSLDVTGGRIAKSIRNTNKVGKVATANKNSVSGLLVGAGRNQKTKLTENNTEEVIEPQTINVSNTNNIQTPKLSYEDELLNAKLNTKNYEQFRAQVYKDGNGIETVGYGSTNPKHIKYAKENNGVDEATANKWFEEHYNSILNSLQKNISNFNEFTPQQQFALADLAFNIGTNKLYNQSPKLMKAIKEKDYAEIARQIDHDILDDNNPGATRRRLDNRKAFWDSYDGVNEDEQFYTIKDNKELHNKYVAAYREQQNKNKKMMGGNINKDSLIYHLNGNVKQGSRYLPFKGKRTKALLGLDTEDLIRTGTNLAGSLLSFGHNLGNSRNIPKIQEPVYKQAEKLNTTYNINPQLNTLSETESNLIKNINNNTTSSNTALNRMQNLKLNTLLSKNELYNTKAEEENKLINADKLNRQEVANENIELYNAYKDKEYARDLKAYELRTNPVNGLINNLAGTVGETINTIESRKAEKNSIADQLDILELKYGTNDIIKRMRDRYKIKL